MSSGNSSAAGSWRTHRRRPRHSSPLVHLRPGPNTPQAMPSRLHIAAAPGRPAAESSVERARADSSVDQADSVRAGSGFAAVRSGVRLLVGRSRSSCRAGARARGRTGGRGGLSLGVGRALPGTGSCGRSPRGRQAAASSGRRLPEPPQLHAERCLSHRILPCSSCGPGWPAHWTRLVVAVRIGNATRAYRQNTRQRRPDPPQLPSPGQESTSQAQKGFAACGLSEQPTAHTW